MLIVIIPVFSLAFRMISEGVTVLSDMNSSALFVYLVFALGAMLLMLV